MTCEADRRRNLTPWYRWPQMGVGNIDTRAPADDWDLYTGHRTRFTDLLMTSASGGSLCLLGAGHCNDVDLDRLATRYSAIHLVDIDKAALLAAVSRQRPAVQALLHVHAPLDLSGFEHRLKRWKRAAPSALDIAAASSAAIASVANLPGPFDLVASACVLTQMSFTARDALGDGHRMLGALRISLVKTHLAVLIGLTARGGSALLACDLTSSTSFPLANVHLEQNLFDVMGDIVEKGAFYHAANPNLIEEVLQAEPVLHAMAGESELLEPWLWRGAFDRTYFVYALRFRRRA
jgi:hypothetical protein